MLHGILHERVDRVEYPVPAPELFAEPEVLTYHFRALGRYRVHERSRRPDHVERVRQHLQPEFVIAGVVRFLHLGRPVLVDIADVRVHQVHDEMELTAVHQPFVLKDRFAGFLQYIPADLPDRDLAVAVLLGGVKARPHGTVEHVGQQVALLEHRVAVPCSGRRVQRLGPEADAPDTKAKAEEMRPQLLGSVIVKQVPRHGRLDRTAAACLFVQEEKVVVDNKLRQLEFAFRRVDNRVFALLAHEHRHFGRTVKIYVVLPEKLVHLRIAGTPPLFPLLPVLPGHLQEGHREGYRGPQRLRPDPDRKAVQPLDARRRHSPLDIPGQPERHQRLSCPVPDPVFGKHRARPLPAVKVPEDQGRRCLAFFVCQFELRKHLPDGVQLVQVILLHVYDRRLQEFADAFDGKLPRSRVDLQLLHPLQQQFPEVLKPEVPVRHIAHFRFPARDGAPGVYKLCRHVLVPKRALIRVGFFRRTAGNRTPAHDLAPVQENACFGVVKLFRGQFHEMAVFVQLPDEIIGKLPVDLSRTPDARSAEKVRADVILLQYFLLLFMVAPDELIDSTFELTAFHQLAVVLQYRRTVTVRPRNKNHVFAAYAVAQKPRKHVGMDENPAYMAKVEFLVAIRHPCRDDSPFWKHGTICRHIIRQNVF